MSTPQGIEPPAPEPPYAPGDLIYDRTRLNGPGFKIIECNALSALLRDAANGATWHALYELPGGHAGAVFVDDRGFTKATVFGPYPYTAVDIGEQLRAARTAFARHFVGDES